MRRKVMIGTALAWVCLVAGGIYLDVAWRIGLPGAVASGRWWSWQLASSVSTYLPPLVAFLAFILWLEYSISYKSVPWIVRMGCGLLNFMAGYLIVGLQLSMFGSVPWPSALWAMATVVGILVSIRVPQGIMRHLVAVGVITILLICGRMWVGGTSPGWLFALALPLLASVFVLEGPSFIRIPRREP